MPRSAAKISQADIARVLRATAQANTPLRVIIDGGKITIEPVAPTTEAAQYKGDIKLW